MMSNNRTVCEGQEGIERLRKLLVRLVMENRGDAMSKPKTVSILG